jgi:lipoprotein-anchoring transpeptidase ErfK/SrfK
MGFWNHGAVLSPRRVAVAFLAIAALAGASCGELPDERASARELAQAPPPTESAMSSPDAEPPESPAPQEFLEIGESVTSQEATPSAGGSLPAPESLRRWEWAVSTKDGRLDVYAAPGGAPQSQVDTLNPWDQRLVFPISKAQVVDGMAWYRVLLGVEPNGSKGWVRGDEVSFERMRHRVVIDLSDRMLRHYRNGRMRHRFSVGIGAPGTPTTPGRFFVWAHLNPRDASGPYGTYLLGLSGFSEVLTDWPGGGRMAIHGTADPSDPGRRVSYGCARVHNPEMNRLRGIPMGTTVLIRA